MPPEYNTERTVPFASLRRDAPHPGDFWRARYTLSGKQIRQLGFQFAVLQSAIQKYIKRVKEDENGEIPIITEYLALKEAKT